MWQPRAYFFDNYNVLLFNEFAFTPQVKYKWYINSWLRFDMFVFYDWPVPHVYFAKNVANIIFSLFKPTITKPQAGKIG